MNPDADHSKLRRVRVRIRGRVQGVGYRYATCHKAGSLGLAGWVRNLPGGDVEAVFQGPPEAVESAISWCREGPPLSRVTRVDLEEESPVADDTSFDVRY